MELALSRYDSGGEQTAAPSEVLFDRLGFRRDGSRIYLDRGAHQDIFPEIALPECSSVRDLIARIQYVRWQEIAGRLQTAGPDYFVDCLSTLGIGHQPGQPRTALGIHENYLTFLPLETLSRNLAGFFATRALLAGGGGIDPDDPFDGTSPRFVLSPRSLVTTQLIAAESLGHRPFVKRSREHHCGPGTPPALHRLQVIGGDPLLTEVGMLLQFGCTLAMIRLAEALALPTPLLAYDSAHFVTDLDGTNRQHQHYPLRGLPSSTSALTYQFLCLEACEAQQERLFGSEEDRLILHYWRHVLEQLATDSPRTLRGLTDYGTKFDLLQDFAAEMEIPASAEGAMHLFSLLLALSRIGGRDDDALGSLFSPYSPDHHPALVWVVSAEDDNAHTAPHDTRAAARSRLVHETHISVSLNELNGIASGLFLNWDGLYQKTSNLIAPVAVFPDPREPYQEAVTQFLASRQRPHVPRPSSPS